MIGASRGIVQRSIAQRAGLRNFQTSARSLDKIFGQPQEGPYSNLPFQVKGRKFIPFSVAWWGVFGFFFGFPFLATYWHLKKAGNL